MINNLELGKKVIKDKIPLISRNAGVYKMISSSGEILSETVIPSLKVKYIIGKNKKNWLIVDYISGN